MKTTLLKSMMTMLAALFSLNLCAYDFAVDGICYTVISLQDLTCELAPPSSDMPAYSGNFSVPSTVKYNGRNFKVVGIGSDSFQSDNLTSVIIPEGVTYINHKAFNCANMKELTIPVSINKIGFQVISTYLRVNITSLVYWCEIEFGDFYYGNLFGGEGGDLYLNGKKVTDLIVPKSVKKIPTKAFVRCRSITSVRFEEGTEISEIGKEAFLGCSNIKYVEIPSTLQKIGDRAFAGIPDLEEVVLQDSDTPLEFAASGNPDYRTPFMNSLSIKKIHLGRKTTSSPEWGTLFGQDEYEFYPPVVKKVPISTLIIGDSFNEFTLDGLYGMGNVYGLGVSDLKTLTIGKNVQSLKDTESAMQVSTIYSRNATPPQLTGAFANKVYMSAVLYVPRGSLSAYQSAEGWKNFWNISEYDYDDIIPSAQSYTLTYVVDGEVYKTYEVEQGTTITPEAAPLKDGYTFSGWSGIPTTMPAKDVTVTGTFTANTVEYVDKASVEIDGIFYRLSAKSRSAEVIAGATKYAGAVTIPATVQLNGAPYSVTSIGTIAFKDCSALTSVKIPEGITSIGIGAFTACTSLSSVSLPNSITEIGNSVFWGCKGLESIKIPSSVTTIGEFAFVDAGLTSLTIPSSVQSIQQHAFQGCKGLTNVTIPGNVVSIDEYAFCGCDNLSSITLENGVTNIGERVFMSCGNLETVVLPNSLEVIGPYAFAGCNQMRTMDMPNSVTTLGDGAFLQCANLETVKLSAGIKTMGTYIFQKCYNLNSVIIPGIKTLTEGMFMNCSNLIQVEMTEGVESFGLGVFYHCTNLPSITIPQSVKSIGQRVFEGCENLTSVTVLSNTPATLTSSSFENASKSVLYVPKGSQNTYQSAAYWKNFAMIVEPYYTLTYMIDDGVYKTVNVNYGESITPEAEPTKEGYTFSGWGEIPAKMPAEDVTIIGSFTLVDAIEDVLVDDEKYQIYIPNGTPVDTLQKGVNILYYSNGSIKKVYIK